MVSTLENRPEMWPDLVLDIRRIIVLSDSVTDPIFFGWPSTGGVWMLSNTTDKQQRKLCLQAANTDMDGHCRNLELAHAIFYPSVLPIFQRFCPGWQRWCTDNGILLENSRRLWNKH